MLGPFDPEFFFFFLLHSKVESPITTNLSYIQYGRWLKKERDIFGQCEISFHE
jgi:hypothetical protein